MFGRTFPGLGRLIIWGNPWHGLVRAGELHLPNDTVIPWAQPNGMDGSSHPEHPGWTLRQRLPWVADVERTEDQLAADAEAGRQWRPDFIVSGTDYRSGVGTATGMHIYGRPVGGWIYAAPDGSRWLVEGGCGLWSWTQGGTITMPVRLSRFGEIDGATQRYSASAVITSATAGQSTPSISGTTRCAKVVDVTPAGNKAVVMLSDNSFVKLALGFLELTLSGQPGMDFALSVSVLRNRTATLGTITLNNPVVPQPYLAGADYAESTDDQRGAPPDCGYVDIIYTPSPAVRPPEVGESSFVDVAVGENRAQIEGRIVSMWYDADGIAQPVLMDMLQLYTVNAPPPTVTTGQPAVWRWDWYESGGACVEGSGSIEQRAQVTINYTRTESRLLEISLQYGEHTTSRRWERTETLALEHAREDDPIASTGGSNAITWSLDRVVTDGEAVVSELHDTGTGSESYPRDPSILYLNDPTATSSFPMQSVITLAGFRRFSNNLLGWWINGAAGSVEDHAAEAMTPLGPRAPTDPLVNAFYGSFNPVTGESIFPSADPVSWT